MLWNYSVLCFILSTEEMKLSDGLILVSPIEKPFFIACCDAGEVELTGECVVVNATSRTAPA